MQKDPSYVDVVKEVKEFLVERALKAQTFGIKKERIFIDPGIGFGKTTEHNLSVAQEHRRIRRNRLSCPDRRQPQAFHRPLTGKEKPADRVFGTAATIALAAVAGISIVRVHDIAPMADVSQVVNRIKNADDRSDTVQG